MADRSGIAATARRFWYGTPDGQPAAGLATARKGGQRVWIIWVAVVVAVLAIVVIARVQDVRAQDRRTDTLYCTLSGVGPFDRGPNTGKLCADLLSD